MLKDAGIDVHHFFLKVPRRPGEADRQPELHPNNPQQDEWVRRWCKDRIELRSPACWELKDQRP
ncbi:hypothetical protein ACSHXN_40975 [Streptomyces sp. HUAS TT11]|uniref:hypothetical protein n=1 Tax=Streptomyces sp. HUAS TT11 TaxID=3447508 RepID=UPI003F65E8C1